MPKKVSSAAPMSSITRRKSVVLIAILRARLRITSDGTNPTSPRNTSADPSGLITGSSALKASAKYFRTVNILDSLTGFGKISLISNVPPPPRASGRPTSRRAPSASRI